jgi:2-polyprenyl-6-methoxyphenol hydroxylase-like FAD-dependent oxidoreductase
MTRAQSIVVAGAGIGGLATALGLARNGFDVVVLERAAVLGEIGAGIQLGPNAFHAFDWLGVGDAARAMAVYVDKLRLMDAMTAEDICSIDLGEPFRKRFGNPYAVVHRGDMHGVFQRACLEDPRIGIRTDCSGRRFGHRSPEGRRNGGGPLVDWRGRVVVESAPAGCWRRCASGDRS